MNDPSAIFGARNKNKIESPEIKLKIVRKTINHFSSIHTEPDQQHLSHKKYINSDFKSRKISALECMKEFHLGDEKI